MRRAAVLAAGEQAFFKEPVERRHDCRICIIAAERLKDPVDVGLATAADLGQSVLLKIAKRTRNGIRQRLESP